jgi:uncharacterized protein (DUF302 family)
MKKLSYGHTRHFEGVSFQEAVDKTTDALKKGGFGVLTEIDVKATLKKKIGVDFRNYKILGACNPPLAHRALSEDLGVGLLLPCNVIVFEEDDGTITVSVVKPEAMFQVVDNQALESLVGEVGAAIGTVIASLEEQGATSA